MDSQLLDLEINDLSRGGSGVGKDSDGRVIFVPLTAPGDRVRVRVVEANKRYATGELVEVLRRSELRVQPRCPAFGRCGGCEWQHLPYDYQWKTKVGGIRHALHRVGLSEIPDIEELSAAGVEWEYRNRIQMRGAGEHLGFFGRKSRNLVPVDRCEIARPELNAELAAVRAEGVSRPREYKVEIEVLEDGSVRKIWNARHAAGGFRQVHDAQNAKLQSWVSQAVPDSATVLDLYGGAGNLSRALAGRVRRIDCVDVGAPARAPEGTPANLHFHRSAVDRWLQRTPIEAKIDGSTVCAIIDPPREGIAQDFAVVAQGLADRSVDRIVLVGCDVDSWARDLYRLTRRGWKPVKLAALDLFPQTHHVESLAFLLTER